LKKKQILIVIGITVLILLGIVGAERVGLKPWKDQPRTLVTEETKMTSKLCVVWTSGDPEIAKNICFMYTRNAKKAGWFDIVHLVVWGPSAKLLSQNTELQTEFKAMQNVGVLTEACINCARNYGVVEELQKLKLDVKGMGKPLSERLQSDWQVVTF
jgi:hypothetical protein